MVRSGVILGFCLEGICKGTDPYGSPIRSLILVPVLGRSWVVTSGVDNSNIGQNYSYSTLKPFL